MMNDRLKLDANPVRQHYTVRVVVSILIVLMGISGFLALAGLKEPPVEVEGGERPLKVNVLPVKAASVPVTITGYGEVRTVKAVNISAEVAGMVMAVHPRLRVGELIDAEELLFRIDDRNYAAAAAQGRAEVNQLDSVVVRLEKQSVIDAHRLKTLTRSRDLAKAEYERVRDLLAEHKVGTRSSVDRAEQAYNAAVDQADQMAQAVSLYPIRIKEARSGLAAARARLRQARANLERCEVRAPFNGRLTRADVEQGQYVSPGQPLVVMADDQLLEIQVPLDSRDVRRWLRFEAGADSRNRAWFGQPEPVACTIRWTEDKQGHAWHGRLHRIVAYDQKTRTITVAVRIAAAEAVSDNGALPLVEGMFCAVEIPGRTLPRAFTVPRAAVSFKNTVFVAVDRRLKTVDVQVARVDGDRVYITGGLSEGDTVIVTRLVDPLENSLLEVMPGG
jgi:RND family efflux transporter MFP subunit